MVFYIPRHQCYECNAFISGEKFTPNRKYLIHWKGCALLHNYRVYVCILRPFSRSSTEYTFWLVTSFCTFTGDNSNTANRLIGNDSVRYPHAWKGNLTVYERQNKGQVCITTKAFIFSWVSSEKLCAVELGGPLQALSWGCAEILACIRGRGVKLGTVWCMRWEEEKTKLHAWVLGFSLDMSYALCSTKIACYEGYWNLAFQLNPYHILNCIFLKAVLQPQSRTCQNNTNSIRCIFKYRWLQFWLRINSYSDIFTLLISL